MWLEVDFSPMHLATVQSAIHRLSRSRYVQPRERLAKKWFDPCCSFSFSCWSKAQLALAHPALGSVGDSSSGLISAGSWYWSVSNPEDETSLNPVAGVVVERLWWLFWGGRGIRNDSCCCCCSSWQSDGDSLGFLEQDPSCPDRIPIRCFFSFSSFAISCFNVTFWFSRTSLSWRTKI